MRTIFFSHHYLIIQKLCIDLHKILHKMLKLSFFHSILCFHTLSMLIFKEWFIHSEICGNIYIYIPKEYIINVAVIMCVCIFSSIKKHHSFS